MTYRIFEGEMPPLNIEGDALREQICKLLSKSRGSFSFAGFTQSFSHHLLTNNIGFAIEPNTSYQGKMSFADIAKIREIIWDLIIERYLTPGGNGHDEWPMLTITTRGTVYFENYK